MKKRIHVLAASVFVYTACLGAGPHPAVTWHLPPHVTSDDYEASVVMAKVRPEFREVLESATPPAPLREALDAVGAARPERLFPAKQPLPAARPAGQAHWVDLSLIYRVPVSSATGIEKIINRLMATGYFSYVEPNYIYTPQYVPNDTMAGQQWLLQLTHAIDAWDVQKGDSNIVIGITDTGIDTTHPDLVGKIRYNTADPINGIDDDGDGYIDNYYGWNVATNTYDVAKNELHGAFVSGIAAAGTDNVTGIAGVGFRCKFFPVACSPNPSLNVIYNGDLAIQYAADHGASIINCSWGGFGRSQFTQDMVNYATFNKDALVVAAAGNAQNDLPFYPASYDNVLSVAGVDSFDVKWTGSSYGSYVDLTAQGDRIISVWPGGGYGFSGGTSEACPQVSGAAALVRSQFPALNALQVGERLRATADNTDALPGNAAYIRKLGKGRLNIYRALTEPAKSIRATSLDINDGNDNAFAAGDTLNISAIFVNFLDTVLNGSVTLSSNSSFITVLNPSLVLGGMGTMAADSNRANPFLAVIDPAMPYNSRVVFTFDFQDGAYSDWQSFELTLNVDYINLQENDIGLTITSRGRLGFNDISGTQGIGFTYNDGPNLLYGSSFLVGINDSTLSDATFSSGGAMDNDFIPVEFIHRVLPSVVSNYDATTLFNDSGNTLPVGVTVRNNTYAWGNPGDRNYVVCEYIIHNTSGAVLSGLHAGIYCDFDITAATYTSNRCGYDAANRMGYQFYVANNNQYAGIELLTAGTPNFYAFDNDGANGSYSIYDGFSKAEKYASMSTVSRLTAGMVLNGNDASMMLGTGPFTLNPGDSVKVAFALLGADSLPALSAAAAAAQVKYDNIGAGIHPPVPSQAGCIVYPNPARAAANLLLFSPVPAPCRIEWSDITGRLVRAETVQLNSNEARKISWDAPSAAGTYIVRVTIGAETFIRKLVVH